MKKDRLLHPQDNTLEKILQLTRHVQELVDLELKKAQENPSDFPHLEQRGLQDGSEIIREFISHNEWGVALDHLVYMIQETEITLNQEYLDILKDIKKHLYRRPHGK